MQRLCFILLILILTSLLAGCAGNAAAQSNEVAPTSVPEKSDPTAIPEVVSKNPPEELQPADMAESETLSHDPPASCPVTVPKDPPFTAPEPYSPDAPFEYGFWFGSEKLWTMLPGGGTWSALPHNSEGYAQKVFWWREGYIWNEEPEPDLIVTGERLDATAPPLRTYKATNAYASDIGSAILVGVDFPTLGCWRVTGQYAEAELSFVIWVAP